MNSTADTQELDVRRAPMQKMEEPPSGAAGLIAAGSQLLQIRTKHQLSIAIQRPRSEKAFADKLIAEAASAGEDFYYSIPYKEHRSDCQDRRHCNCPSRPVEGAGVGLTRSAARLWGNCSVEVTIEQDLPDCWIARGWFVDFESNFTRSEVKRISKFKPLKGGRYVKASEKELDVTYQQGASKVERDVVKRSLPNSVIERAFEIAKAAALQSKEPIRTQIARLIHKFQEVDVSLAMIEAYIKCQFTEEAMSRASLDPRDTCASLRGLLTAIKGGDVTVEEVFCPEPANGKKQVVSGPVSASDFVGQQPSAQQEPAKAPNAPTEEQQADPTNPSSEGSPTTTEGQATTTATDKPEPGLYTCTACGWTGDKTARGGKCPKCRADKEKVEATADLGTASKDTAEQPQQQPARAYWQCLSDGCGRTYREKPAKCQCGSALGFRDLQRK